MKRINQPRRSSRLRGRSVAALSIALCLMASFVGWAPRARAQANTASLVINKVFVNQSGQPVNAPSGSAAGVVFTLTPTTAGQQATTLTTAAGAQASSGTAIGSAQAGSYTFQETVPAGTVFLSASVSQNGGQSQSLNQSGPVSLAPGASYVFNVVDQVTGQSSTPGTASLTIFKSLNNATGQPTTGILSGYSFTLAGQGGLPTQTQVTNQLGQASFTTLPAGVYAITEAPATGTTFGSMTINSVAAQQGQQFQIQAGGTYNVLVTNIVSGTASGNITIQKQVVDQNGQPIASASLSGYTFTITPQSTGVGTPTVVTSSSAGQATANVPPGSYVISETSAGGASLLSFSINGVPTQTGAFTVGTGQTTNIVVINRATTAAAGNPATTTRTVSLQTGCNNVTLTYADGTAGQAIAAAVVPAGSIDSIWRFDNVAQAYRAAYFRPSPGGIAPPVDIQGVNRLDAVFICVTTPATFTEPGV